MILPTDEDFDILPLEKYKFKCRSRHLRKILGLLFVASVLLFLGLPGSVHAGSAGKRQASPPLDHTLMAFKQQGIWYFLCDAPIPTGGIPPSYLSYFPPPPPCGPIPYPPAMSRYPVK
jgi:hypothetical protein